jgi:hypothetical protein
MRALRYLPVATLVAIGACADTTSPTVDVNSLAEESATASYSAAAYSASVGGFGLMPLPQPGSASCAYSVTSQRFECVPVTMGGITFTRSFALLDANNNPLSTPNPAAVASVHTITDIKGTMSDPGRGGSGPVTMTIDHHEDATLSQLQSAIHILNSTSAAKTSMTMTGFSISSIGTSTASNLQLPRPTAEVHWPLGGTITTDRTDVVSGMPGMPGMPPSHEVITFDGTSIMTLTRTLGGVTQTCKIDLAKRGMAICV